MPLFVPLTRRALLAATASALALPRWRSAIAQPAAATLTLRARPGTLQLGAAASAAPMVVLDAGSDAPPRLRAGSSASIAIVNALPVAARFDWRGVDGLTQDNQSIAPGDRNALTLLLSQPGTLLCRVEPLADWPPAALAVVVEEPAAAAFDREETLLIEDWRMASDGRAVAPGQAPGNATTAFTANRRRAPEFVLRPRERLRFRFINGTQNTVFAIRIPDYNVTVWAIDSRPAEPFVAHNSQFALAPGSRVDVLIDGPSAPGTATPILLHDGIKPHTIGRLIVTGAPVRVEPLPPPAPLPTDGLPATLDLARAVRVTLDVAAGSGAEAPAFTLKRGQVAVLALKNDSPQPAIVALFGHHARLLDRLDDGWKPFWVDTLLVPPRTTERIAFLAEHAGRFPIETTAPVWGAPRRARWYTVA